MLQNKASLISVGKKIRRIAYWVAVVEGSVLQTIENDEEGDWRWTSLQASEEERRDDNVGTVELPFARASKQNLTKLQLLSLWVVMSYNNLEAHNWINNSDVYNEVHML